MNEEILEKKKIWLYLIIFIAFSLVLYWPSLMGEPFWDDWVDIFKSYRQQLDAASPLDFFWIGPGAKSWPVFYTIIWSMLKIFKDHYIYFHLTNIVFHGVNGFLTWEILKKVHVKNPLLWALLFTAHPLHLFTVGWIIQLKTIFSIFFFLCSLLFLIKFFNGQALHAYFLTILFFTLSILTKSTTVGLGFVILFSYPLFKNKMNFKKFCLYFIVPIFTLSLIAAARTVFHYNWRMFLNSNRPRTYVLLNELQDPIEKFVLTTKVFSRYVKYVLFPFENVHLFQSQTVLTFISFEFLAVFITLIGLIGLITYLLRKKLYLELLGTLFFLATILPFSGMFYIPIFGVTNFVPYWLSIPVLGLLPLGAHFIKSKNALIIFILVLSFHTHWQSYQFINTEELFLESINRMPENELIKLSLIDQYVNTQQCEKAAKLYSELRDYKETKMFNIRTKVNDCEFFRAEKK